MLVNMTPHEIVVLTSGGEVKLPPSGKVARCAVKTVAAQAVDGLPVNRQEFGAVEGLPEPQEGVWLVVSTLVAQQAKRADVISPDTGPSAVRENGQVKAVRGFQSFA